MRFLSKKRLSLGFTMVELVVISVVLSVFILATITYINPRTQFEKARDTRRRADLSEYRTALEAYSAVHGGLYPSLPSNINRLDTTVYTAALQPFMSSAPADPAPIAGDNPYVYHYVAETVAGGTDEMALIDLLEAKDSTFWIICSNGKTGEYFYSLSDLWDVGNRILVVNNFCGYTIGT